MCPYDVCGLQVTAGHWRRQDILYSTACPFADL